MTNTLVMIPTYNEKENIERLILEIFRYAPEINVLVVDDDSPDGTGKIVDKIARKDKRVSVLHRTADRGRGLAGIAGFKEAIKRDSISYVIEMDGDFSHDPKHIPQFLKEIEDCDVVVGSRYINRGKDCDRGTIRIMLSRLANLFIKKYLGLNVKDCTSGYRCFKKGTLSALDLNNISSKGPSIVEEILHKCKLNNCRIKEIPIVFKTRIAGRSKLGITKLVSVFTDILSLKHASKRRNLRKFGFSFGLGLNILGCIMFYRHKEHFIWFTGIGSCGFILAILCPVLLAPLKKIMDSVIFSLGWITKTFTSVVSFYFIFAPIGILLRILRKDPLHQKIDKKAGSYWIKHKKPPFFKELYERMG